MFGDGERPVVYFSKKMLSAQYRYTATEEEEALAIVKAIEHFAVYLYGRTFIIDTDH